MIERSVRAAASNRATWLAALLVAIGVAVSAGDGAAQVAITPRPQPAAAAETAKPNLRAQANLVLVPISVTDMRNHPVTGLEKQNFKVFDNGVEQPIVSFASEDAPVALGLVYDRSGSVSGAISAEAVASRLALSATIPSDEYFLVLFSSQPELALPLTKNSEDVQNRIYSVRSSGATALFDGVILALNELKKSKMTRKALLVISDGGENNSRYGRREVQKFVEEADSLIYSIGFPSDQEDFGLLKWISELSGGRAFPAANREIPDITAKIGLELHNRYVVGFAPSKIQRDGKYHTIKVQLVPPHGMPPLKCTWRQGYRAPDDSIH